ncbi:unnamed protein product [Penicillium camemberti]|uniref:Str. FM013 n=1 Tax=Penicillium camemberti (strain FM 013) TaxID=1429867 RepID=A0A0G4P6T9_PENC3|nr:unnamed protein product [Penicillium camemberti]
MARYSQHSSYQWYTAQRSANGLNLPALPAPDNTMKLMPKAWVHPQVFQGVHRQLWSACSR